MARVPAVPNISKDTAAPDERNIDVDAGVLDVDAEVPDDYNWDDLPDDDDEPMPNSDEKPHQLEPPQRSDPSNHKPQTHQPSTRNSPPRDSSLPNGHASRPLHDPYAARDPYASKAPPGKRNPRPDGVVADPMGVDRMEEGEIDQRRYKKKDKKKPPPVKHHCEICNVTVFGDITMQSHLKGQKHKRNERQAAITKRNQAHVEHEKAIISQNEPPHNPQQPGNARNSSNIPPQRLPAGPSNSQRLSERAEEMPNQRDPYVQREMGRPAEPSLQTRQAVPDDARNTSRDPRLKSRASEADRKERPEKEKDISDARNSIDPYANRDLYPPKDPNATKDSYKPNLYSSSRGDPYAIRDHKKSGDSSGAKAAESNPTPVPKDPLPQQNGGKETRDSDEGRKRKHPDDGSSRNHAHVERNSPDRAPDRSHYESTGDGTARRKLDDNLGDPRKRDSNVNSHAPQPRAAIGPSEPAPSKEQPGPPLQTSEPMKPRPLQFFSVPAPSPAGSRTERRENRRPADTRRFTYGPAEREQSVAIPFEWLSQPMDTSEWRDLRTVVFERGTDVDRLAYKMLQEILLSPVLGVNGKSLAPFSRAMLNAVKDQRLSTEEAYAKFADFPEPLSVRDENYAKGDPEWQKSQTPEDLAVKLVSENILFCLNPYEDNEDVGTTELHNIPRRGSFGQKNMVKSSRDGGMSPRYQDSVEQDELFNQLYEHLLYRNMSR